MIKGLLCKVFNLVSKDERDHLNKEFSQRIYNLKEEQKKYLIEIENLQSEKNLLEKMYSSIKEEYEGSLFNNVTIQNSLKAKVENLEADIKNQASEYQSISKSKEILLEENAKLMKENLLINDDNTKLRVCVAEFICMIAGVNARKNEEIDVLKLKYESALSKLQNENLILLSQIKNIESKKKEYLDVISRLEKEKDFSRSDRNNMILEIEELKRCLDYYKTLTNGINDKRDKVERNLKSEIKELKDDIYKLNERLGLAQKENITLSTHIQKIEEQRERRNNEVSNLRNDINKYKRQLSIEREIMLTAQKRFDSEKSSMRDLLNAINIQNEELKESYQKQMRSLEDENKSLVVLKEDLLKEKINLRGELEEYHSKNKELEKEVELLKISQKVNSNSSIMKSDKAKRQRTSNKDYKLSIHLVKQPEHTLKNLKLTESVSVVEVAKKAGAYKEVLRKDTINDSIAPQIQHIIDKLHRINLDVSYKNGVFYYQSKTRGKEKLLIQHFEEYNKVILLLYDGKKYCGFDMESGKRVSEMYNKKSYALAELDEYLEGKH